MKGTYDKLKYNNTSIYYFLDFIDSLKINCLIMEFLCIFQLSHFSLYFLQLKINNIFFTKNINMYNSFFKLNATFC